MYIKFLRGLSIAAAVVLIATSLGACKKDDQSAAAATTAKAGATSAAKKSAPTSKNGSSTSTTKTGSSTNKQDGTGTTSSGSASSDGQSISSDGQYSSSDGSQGGSNGGDTSGSVPTESLVIDLGGRKMLVKTINDIPVEPTPEEVALNPKAGLSYRMWKAAEQKLNFTAEWEKVDLDGHVVDYINATTAGVKYADVIITQSKRIYPVLPVADLLVPIENYIDFNDPLYNYDFLKESSRFNGKIYGLGSPYAICYAVYYNRDITDREGIEIFNTYVKTGNWTWDVMADIARATTKDLNGDGVIDQWGIMINNTQQTMDMMLFSNGARYFEYRDGRYVFTGNEPKAIKTLQYMSDLKNVQQVAQFDKTNGLKWENGNGCIVLGKLFGDAKNYKKLGINYGFAPLPKGPDVTEYQNVEGNGGGFAVIPLNCDAAASAAVIKEALTTWDSSKPEYYSKEDMIYNKIAGVLNYQEEIDWAFANYVSPQVSLHKVFSNVWSTYTNEVTNKVYGQETTPAAALQTVEPLAQAALDAYLGY